MSLIIYVPGLHDNDVLESILEGRETRLFARGRDSDVKWRFRGKDLGAGYVFRERQKQVILLQ